MHNWSKKVHTELELCKCRFKFIQIAVAWVLLLKSGSRPSKKNGPLARPRPGRPITNWVFLSQSNDINF